MIPQARGGAALVLAAVMGLALSACVQGSGEGSCAGLRATVTGSDGPDRLRGTPGRDVIWGAGGDDRIEGFGGDDVLCGGSGADRLTGGPGDDVVDGGTDRRYAVDTDSYEWAGDTLAGGTGDDTLVPGPHEYHGAVDEVTYAAASSGVTVDLARGSATGEGNDRIRTGVATLVGSRHDDLLLGSEHAESIRGGLGADHIEGRGGRDKLDGAGSPRVETTRHEGRDVSPNVLIGGPGVDELQGAEGDDVIEGGAGNDALYGDLGADRLSGGPGRDSIADYVLPTRAPRAGLQVLDGGAGQDVLGDLCLTRFGATGDEGVYADGTGTVDLAAGTVRGRVERDQFELRAQNFSDLQSPLGTWTVFGTDGANEIMAIDEKRGVVIHARGGDDRLSGTFADDLLDGGPGRDDASGYVGKDRYVAVEKIRR